MKEAPIYTLSGQIEGEEYGVVFEMRGLTKRQAHIIQDHIEHFIIDRFSEDGLALDAAPVNGHHH